MKTIRPILTICLSFGALSVSAQDYEARVSKDSVAILNARTEVLKTAFKLNELKLSEAEQEADIEKQKLKILDLTSTEKEASKEYARLSEALKVGKETDIKKIEKMSRKATNSAKEVQNALDKLKKQIDKIEETRTEIQTEERKLANRSPMIIFKY